MGDSLLPNWTGWFGHFQSQKPWLGVMRKMALVTENGATPSLVCIAYTGTGSGSEALLNGNYLRCWQW
jgi:Tfp pilus assembly protein PilW